MTTLLESVIIQKYVVHANCQATYLLLIYVNSLLKTTVPTVLVAEKTHLDYLILNTVILLTRIKIIPAEKSHSSTSVH